MKIFFSLLIFAIQCYGKTEISIAKNVEISQRPLLRLSDIAEVNQGSEEVLTFMDEVVLREDARELLLSQAMGSQEILHKIKSALNAQDSKQKMKLTFKIPSEIKIDFSPSPISKQEIERKILNVLKTQCHSCDYKLSIQSIPSISQRQWELDFSKLNPKGGFLLPVKEGVLGEQKWISGTIRVSQLTPVASKLILQGERVQPEDIQMVMTDITYAKDSTLRLSDIQGQLAVRTLPLGSPVWSSDLKREPAAKKGQMVKALVVEDGFEISTSMIAEDNGFIGDLIKVKNLQTQTVLSGSVVEKGVVKLQ